MSERRASGGAVQVLVDRDEIHDVMLRYADGVDRRDMDQVRSCFAPDLEVVDWGGGFPDREAMITYISGVAIFHTTMHMFGNEFIAVDGDCGHVDLYAMLTHHRDDGAGVTHELNVSGARYVETLARRDGRWVITRRGGEPQWGRARPTQMVAGDAATQWLLDRAEIHDVMMQDALGREQFSSTTHFLGSLLVDVDRDDAWVQSSSLVAHRREEPDPSGHYVSAGYSVDRLVREEGRWRIAERGSEASRDPPEAAPVPESEDPRVQRLLDRAAVHDVIVSSALARDREHEGRDRRILNNVLVAVDGDEATAQTYVYVVEQQDDGSPSRWGGGARRWIDRLQRVDGRWQLQSRKDEDTRVPDELLISAGEAAARAGARTTRRSDG